MSDFGVPNGLIADDIGKPLRSDSITHVLETIDYAHHEIHGGDSYIVTDVQNVSTTTIKYQITTPDTAKLAHMLFAINCTGEFSLLITEGSDRVDGSALVEINRNRNSSNTAGIIATLTPTGGSTDGAVTIFNIRTGATGPGISASAPGVSRADNEFILKQNTKYVIAVTTYADVYVNLVANWYEHTNRN